MLSAPEKSHALPVVRYINNLLIIIIIIYQPSSGLFFISPDEDLLFEVETS